MRFDANQCVLKKGENHARAVALPFMISNAFTRGYPQPAMESGLSDHVWTLEEVAALAG